MYAIATDVAAHLGRPLSAAETTQVTLWIGWLEADIEARIDVAEVDGNTVQRVVVESIADYMRNPDRASQVAVQVDDANITKRYSSSSGRVQVLPELWADLGWVPSGAFTVTPYGAPDTTAAAFDAW